jgi:hypothetical protein
LAATPIGRKEKVEVLLLLAALANWLHYMFGLSAELTGKQLCRLNRMGNSGEEIQAAVR